MGRISLAIILVLILICSSVVLPARAAGGISVKQSADKITITGGKGEKIASDKFLFNKDAWYIIKISYTGANYSICQLSLVTQNMIDEKTTVGGMLTNWMGPNTTEKIRDKGSVKSENYMIYVENANGPWTVEILKSPKPSPVSDKTSFSGTKNSVTPFFNLKKGPAKCTMHQRLKGQFSSRLEVNLYNATTGAYVKNLCHNDTSPEQKMTVDIPESGPYVMEITGGDAWEVSAKQ